MQHGGGGGGGVGGRKQEGLGREGGGGGRASPRPHWIELCKYYFVEGCSGVV